MGFCRAYVHVLERREERRGEERRVERCVCVEMRMRERVRRRRGA